MNKIKNLLENVPALSSDAEGMLVGGFSSASLTSWPRKVENTNCAKSSSGTNENCGGCTCTSPNPNCNNHYCSNPSCRNPNCTDPYCAVISPYPGMNDTCLIGF